MLLVTAALVVANVAGEPQAPATGGRSTAAQDQSKSATSASTSSRRRKIPCKTPENASQCYWTHGRLERYLSFDGEDGEDARWHLWKIGTRRVVRVCNGPHFPPLSWDDCATPEFPANLQQVYKDRRNWEPSFIDDTRLSPLTVFGDFEICSLEPERKGKMQTVCMESAKGIFVDRTVPE